MSKLIYVFEYDNLVGVVVDFADTEDVRKEAKTFYKERYPVSMALTGTQDSVFINDGRNKAVYLTNNASLGFYASYGNVTFTNGRLSTYSGTSDSLLKKLK